MAMAEFCCGLKYGTVGRPREKPGGGGDLQLVATMLICVCRKVKDMGPYSGSSE